jgi:hypothetical protein
MPSVSFLADEDDFSTILAYLSANPEVAFIVAARPGRWRAVAALERIDVDRTALWHVPSGPLPLLAAAYGQPSQLIQDPWSGWNERYPGKDRSCPYFGAGHPGIIWLIHNPEGPGTSHGVGISEFGWIGNHYSIIGRPADPATERFWKDLRRWLVRETKAQGSTRDSRAFPSAFARIQAARGHDPDPARE